MGQWQSDDREVDIVELQALYKKFVVECPSGALYLHEFKGFFGVTDTTEESLYMDNMFRTFDTNKDNTIDFLEYIAALNLVLRGKLEHKLRWSFKVYDGDGNGTLTKDEVTQVIRAIYKIKKGSNEEEEHPALTPDEVCDRIFHLVDENGDGQLSVKEFIEGAQKDRWVMKMLKLNVNPSGWIIEHRRQSAPF